MNRIKTGHQVQLAKNGRLGMAVNDLMSCCADFETPVVWDGEGRFNGTDTADLKDLGIPDHTPNHIKCGSGKGAECCIYLTAGAGGFSCERFSTLRHTLQFRTMNAKRKPKEVYPDCMISEEQPHV